MSISLISPIQLALRDHREGASSGEEEGIPSILGMGMVVEGEKTSSDLLPELNFLSIPDQPYKPTVPIVKDGSPTLLTPLIPLPLPLPLPPQVTEAEGEEDPPEEEEGGGELAGEVFKDFLNSLPPSTSSTSFTSSSDPCILPLEESPETSTLLRSRRISLPTSSTRKSSSLQVLEETTLASLSDLNPTPSLPPLINTLMGGSLGGRFGMEVDEPMGGYDELTTSPREGGEGFGLDVPSSSSSSSQEVKLLYVSGSMKCCHSCRSTTSPGGWIPLTMEGGASSSSSSSSSSSTRALRSGNGGGFGGWRCMSCYKKDSPSSPEPPQTPPGGGSTMGRKCRGCKSTWSPAWFRERRSPLKPPVPPRFFPGAGNVVREEVEEEEEEEEEDVWNCSECHQRRGKRSLSTPSTPTAPTGLLVGGREGSIGTRTRSFSQISPNKPPSVPLPSPVIHPIQTPKRLIIRPLPPNPLSLKIHHPHAPLVRSSLRKQVFNANNSSPVSAVGGMGRSPSPPPLESTPSSGGGISRVSRRSSSSNIAVKGSSPTFPTCLPTLGITCSHSSATSRATSINGVCALCRVTSFLGKFDVPPLKEVSHLNPMGRSCVSCHVWNSPCWFDVTNLNLPDDVPSTPSGGGVGTRGGGEQALPEKLGGGWMCVGCFEKLLSLPALTDSISPKVDPAHQPLSEGQKNQPQQRIKVIKLNFKDVRSCPGCGIQAGLSGECGWSEETDPVSGHLICQLCSGGPASVDILSPSHQQEEPEEVMDLEGQMDVKEVDIKQDSGSSPHTPPPSTSSAPLVEDPMLVDTVPVPVPVLRKVEDEEDEEEEIDELMDDGNSEEEDEEEENELSLERLLNPKKSSENNVSSPGSTSSSDSVYSKCFSCNHVETADDLPFVHVLHLGKVASACLEHVPPFTCFTCNAKAYGLKKKVVHPEFIDDEQFIRVGEELVMGVLVKDCKKCRTAAARARKIDAAMRVGEPARKRGRPRTVFDEDGERIVPKRVKLDGEGGEEGSVAVVPVVAVSSRPPAATPTRVSTRVRVSTTSTAQVIPSPKKQSPKPVPSLEKEKEKEKEKVEEKKVQKVVVVEEKKEVVEEKKQVVKEKKQVVEEKKAPSPAQSPALPLVPVIPKKPRGRPRKYPLEGGPALPPPPPTRPLSARLQASSSSSLSPPTHPPPPSLVNDGPAIEGEKERRASSEDTEVRGEEAVVEDMNMNMMMEVEVEEPLKVLDKGEEEKKEEDASQFKSSTEQALLLPKSKQSTSTVANVVMVEEVDESTTASSSSPSSSNNSQIENQEHQRNRTEAATATEDLLAVLKRNRKISK